jgi:hypothetical protein
MRRAVLIGAMTAAMGVADKSVLPNKPGRKLVVQVCTKCHPAETFAGLRMTRKEWRHEVDGMIARGAKADKVQARRIVDYLAVNLGKNPPAR